MDKKQLKVEKIQIKLTNVELAKLKWLANEHCMGNMSKWIRLQIARARRE